MYLNIFILGMNTSYFIMYVETPKIAAWHATSKSSTLAKVLISGRRRQIYFNFALIFVACVEKHSKACFPFKFLRL